MSGTARETERQWSEAHAKVVTWVRYPTMWAMPVLAAPIVGQGIHKEFGLWEPWAYVCGLGVELLGVATGANAVRAKGWRQQVPAWLLFGCYEAVSGAFCYLAHGPKGLVWPGLTLVAYLSSNMQAKRQEDREAVEQGKADARKRKVEAQALAIRLQAEQERLQARQQEAARAALQDDNSLPTRERVRRYFAREPQGSVKECATLLGITRQAVQEHRKALVRESKG